MIYYEEKAFSQKVFKVQGCLSFFAWIFKESSSDIDKPNGFFVPSTNTKVVNSIAAPSTKLETINLFNLRFTFCRSAFEPQAITSRDTLMALFSCIKEP